MRQRTTAGVTALALATLLLGTTQSASAEAKPYLHERVRQCVPLSGGGCRVSVVTKYSYRQGSTQRRVDWVYASLGRPAKGRVYAARWVYKRPGGSWKVGGSWKRPRHRGEGAGAFVETWWGSGGHAGPHLPQSTRLCTEFKGVSAKACVMLK